MHQYRIILTKSGNVAQTQRICNFIHLYFFFTFVFVFMVASELAAKGQGIITCSTSKLANMAILFLADSVISVVDLQNTYNHK